MTSISESDGTSAQEKQRQVLDDNARKFVARPLDPEFLAENGATSFLLVTDWLETNQDTEKKLAYKKFENGNVELLLISKVMKDGKRTAEKEQITEERYAELINKSICHVEKTRYEFDYLQHGTRFGIKYDAFIDSELRLLEVDASSDDERESFDPMAFPGNFSEVTGNLTYYGYRVAGVV